MSELHSLMAPAAGLSGGLGKVSELRTIWPTVIFLREKSGAWSAYDRCGTFTQNRIFVLRPSDYRIVPSGQIVSFEMLIETAEFAKQLQERNEP